MRVSGSPHLPANPGPDAEAERERERRRWVTAEPLNVSPGLVGLPLATPWRRALAIGIDLLVLALLSGSPDLWLFVGLVLVVLQLRKRRAVATPDAGAGGGTADQGASAPGRQPWGWVLAALVVWLAASQAVGWWKGHDGAQAPTAATAALADDDSTAEPAAARSEADLLPAPASAPASAASATATAAAASAAAAAREAAADRRIAQLKRELAAARAARPKTLREQAEELFDLIGSKLGWAIVYFSLLPAWWGGQTLGKRALGLRTVRLTGEGMTVMASLKRYGGYAAGIATGGLGFAQVLWDPNRQGLHDKAAHTVVIDLRSPARPQRTGFPQQEAPLAPAILPPAAPTQDPTP